MTHLYLTADNIGTPTGGGLVTAQELMALRSLGDEVRVLSRKELEESTRRFPDAEFGEPWKWDQLAWSLVGGRIGLTHIYSGTFSESVNKLEANGTKVIYTVAAHSVEVSRREHEKLGVPYAELYPHLCQPNLWRRYSAGYFAADHIVCPSTYSQRTVEKQAADLGVGCPPITVIPHGCHLPDRVKSLPKQFVVGYMGAYGPDKGVIYLLAAWKKLNYKDAVLVLAGRDSTSEYVQQLVRGVGGGNVRLMGWVDDVTTFYNQISLYVQPSATEGFGIEVLEAMAHDRPVICSRGAGAADVVKISAVLPACDVDALADHIDRDRDYITRNGSDSWGDYNRRVAEQFTWDKIRERYVALYREILG